MSTSKEYIVNFIAYLRRKNKSKNTLIAYSKDLEQIANANSNLNLDKFTAEDLIQTLDKLTKEFNLSPKSVSRKINSIRTFYKYLLSKKAIVSNPALNLDHPRFTHKKQRVLTQTEFLALREVSRSNLKLYTMIEILLQTGIRISELSKLKIKDINLEPENPYIHIISDDRKVELNSKAVNCIRNYLNKQNKIKLDMPLFPTRSGKYIDVRNIRSSIDRALSKAKVKNACVNDIRNTFIVYQLAEGIPIEPLALLVGHKNISTTQNYLKLVGKKYKPGNVARVFEL